MNFCSHCGSSALRLLIPEGDQRVRQVCTVCQTIHYQNPNMVVGCLVINEGKVLLAKRGIDPRSGFWNIPAGFLENDETVEAGAQREVFEETGLQVGIQTLHTIYNLPSANQVYLIFLSNVLSGTLTTNAESTEIAWFAENEIPWEQIAFSSNAFALQKYFEDVKQKNALPGVHIGTFVKHKS